MQRNEDAPVVIKVSDAWKRLILFVQNELPEGTLSVKIVNGQPTELLEAKRRIRFDRAVPTFTSNVLNP